MPQVIVLDEPNSNLDAAGEGIGEAILSAKEGGATVVVVSHRPSLLASITILPFWIMEVKFGPREQVLNDWVVVEQTRSQFYPNPSKSLNKLELKES